ncbi:hypothetical protein YC2023_011127 [Brassica napus]
MLQFTLSVVALKSLVQPESHQTSQTGHLGDTRDIRSVQGVYLDNQKDFVYENNFTRRITHQGVIEALNFKKISTDKKVMDFTNWRFPTPSSCDPTMKLPSPEKTMGFKKDVLAFHKARNQKNWLRKNQDAINFPKPAKPTTIMESCQPLQFGSNQTFLWKPGDTLSQPEDKEDVHRRTSTQRIRRILFTIYFPYPATPYAFKESLHHLVSKEKRLYSLEPEETKILRILIRSQRLLFCGYFSKI